MDSKFLKTSNKKVAVMFVGALMLSIPGLTFAHTVINSEPVFQSPQEEKQQVLDELIALRAVTDNPTDDQDLANAIQSLSGSLDSQLWIDSFHPSSESVFEPTLGDSIQGNDVFDDEQDALAALDRIVNNDQTTLDVSAIHGFMDRIVAADRALAETAINEAADDGSVSGIRNAQTWFGLGDAAVDRDDPFTAVESFENAWDFAVTAH